MITYKGQCGDCYYADNCPDAVDGDGCERYTCKYDDDDNGDF